MQLKKVVQCHNTVVPFGDRYFYVSLSRAQHSLTQTRHTGSSGIQVKKSREDRSKRQTFCYYVMPGLFYLPRLLRRRSREKTFSGWLCVEDHLKNKKKKMLLLLLVPSSSFFIFQHRKGRKMVPEKLNTTKQCPSGRLFFCQPWKIQLL